MHQTKYSRPYSTKLTCSLCRAPAAVKVLPSSSKSKTRPTFACKKTYPSVAAKGGSKCLAFFSSFFGRTSEVGICYLLLPSVLSLFRSPPSTFLSIADEHSPWQPNRLSYQSSQISIELGPPAQMLMASTLKPTIRI